MLSLNRLLPLVLRRFPVFVLLLVILALSTEWPFVPRVIIGTPVMMYLLLVFWSADTGRALTIQDVGKALSPMLVCGTVMALMYGAIYQAEGGASSGLVSAMYPFASHWMYRQEWFRLLDNAAFIGLLSVALSPFYMAALVTVMDERSTYRQAFGQVALYMRERSYFVATCGALIVGCAWYAVIPLVWNSSWSWLALVVCGMFDVLVAGVMYRWTKCFLEADRSTVPDPFA